MSRHIQLIGTRASHFVDPVQRLGYRAEIISSPEEISPLADICLASGVHYLFKEKFLTVPKLGVWGFHETALPEGRGSAPLQWTVLNGIETLTVSFFQLTPEPDAGPLLGQESAPITRTMMLEDLRALALKLSVRLLESRLPAFLEGTLKPSPQIGTPTHYRKRTPEDSKLDPSESLNQLWDHLRVCDNEEFPAWFEVDGKKFILKRLPKN